jgi:hypothetical protein
MKLVDFSIDENHGLCVGACQVDLHNDYNFTGFKYDPCNNFAEFQWLRADTASPLALHRTVILRFIELRVFFAAMEYRADTVNDSETLDFIGFLHSEDVDVMNGCLTQSEADSTYHLIIRFLNGMTFKCYANSVTCECHSCENDGVAMARQSNHC